MYGCNITELDRYGYLKERFEKAFAFLSDTDLAALTPGTTVEIGDGVAAQIKEYATVPPDTLKFETHRHVFDIQYMVAGEELVGVVPAKGLTEDGAYDPKNDMQYYRTPEHFGGIVLRDGDFLVLSPEDAHRPNGMTGESRSVRKIVVKVAL